jgi:DNA helicase HerA-like ATPase
VNYLAESWPVQAGEQGNRVQTWSDLARFSEYPEEVVAHRSTLVHFMAYLQRFRRSTLFVDRRKTSVFLGSEIKKIKAGEVFVVDIARLPTLEEQSLVVGDVMRAVDELHSAQNAARTAAAAKYLIVFIDEVNRFLPSAGPSAAAAAGARRMSATAEQVMKTVIAGRSRNTVLFSAQQFKSAVDAALHENTGTHTFAKLGMTELASAPYYNMIDDSVKRSIVRLNKGEIVMAHPAFRHPIKITFPRASFKRQ